MKFYKYGNVENPKIMFLHGVLTPWHILTPQIEHFKERYYVIVPALNGHDGEKSEFISIEQEARQIEDDYLSRHGDSIFALCGLSMGGLIAFQIWKNQRIKIDHLVMDGAPLVPSGKFMTTMMTKFYLRIVHQSQKRDEKTLLRFGRHFLPKKYLAPYLNIIDQMSDETVKNMVKSTGNVRLEEGIAVDGTRLLYIYGTKMNEMLSKKSAKLMEKYYPGTVFIRCENCTHLYYAVFKPEKWNSMVESFLISEE